MALIVDAALTLTTVETFRKRHDFHDWITRSRVDPTTRAQLERMMLEARPVLTAPFEIERAGNGASGLVAFSDTKTLFVATQRRA